MKTTAMWTTLLAVVLAPVLAQEPSPAPPPEAQKPPPAAQPAPPPEAAPEPPAAPDWKNKGARKQGLKLAMEFVVSEQEVFDLRAKGLGWGEIRHALGIARKSGQPVSEVLALRDSGLGWGQVAQHYGFKLGEVGRDEEKGREELPDDARDAVGERREPKAEPVRAADPGADKRMRFERNRPAHSQRGRR